MAHACVRCPQSSPVAATPSGTTPTYTRVGTTGIPHPHPFVPPCAHSYPAFTSECATPGGLADAHKLLSVLGQAEWSGCDVFSVRCPTLPSPPLSYSILPPLYVHSYTPSPRRLPVATTAALLPHHTALHTACFCGVHNSKAPTPPPPAVCHVVQVRYPILVQNIARFLGNLRTGAHYFNGHVILLTCKCSRGLEVSLMRTRESA